ncbi:MAG: ATP-binding protein [Bacteroidaceae bacterium]|nr:ATP-binding protein [Bacteroidaceae bacterium]
MELNPNLGGDTQEVLQPETTIVTPEPAPVITPQQPVEAPVSTEDDSQIMGLSQEEINDPNAIVVTIADKTAPIVVLFGPPACGKTMTLVRLTRWLRKKNYTVEPVNSFRPASDTHYAKMCRDFSAMIGSNDAANSTKNISFMLVRVLDHMGRTICQILEAPGEYYYNPNDPDEPNVDFPLYVNTIKNSTNRKIWCYMVEPDWVGRDQSLNYVQKIHKLKRGNMRASDKHIFIFNKIDLTSYVQGPGVVAMQPARKAISDLYPGIFEPFRTKGILFGYSDNFTLVPFHTGDYSRRIAGGYTFTEGPDEYPRNLWNAILKYVKG